MIKKAFSFGVEAILITLGEDEAEMF